MLRIKILVLTAVLTFSQLTVFSSSAEAGPLLDWLRNACRRRPTLGQTASTNACCAPQQQLASVAPQQSFSVSADGLQPGQCRTTCMKTCTRTVVNYVPTTSYRTSWDRVPVTQYRPETKSDPCTGCTVTCMKPCTTYTYRMKREPYTSYKPVYRQESYKVPVTTITNNCATGGCSTGTCATCPTGGSATSAGFPPAAPAPVYSQPAPTFSQGSGGFAGSFPQQPSVTTAPSGTITTDGGFGQGLPTVPAEISPSLNPQNLQRPPAVFEFDRPAAVQGSATRTQLQPRQFQQENWTSTKGSDSEWENEAPAKFDYADKLAKSEIRRKWKYTPVSEAYASIENEETSEPAQSEPEVVEFKGSFAPVRSRTKTQAKPKRKVNSGWETVDW